MGKFRPLFIAGICAILAFVFFRGIPTACVKLPSGMNIGLQAVIDLSRPYFLPDIVPKFDNGKSLLPADAWPFFATQTTVHGRAMEADAKDDFWFAWRKDEGLVRRDEDPTRYQRLLKEAGPLLDGTRHGAFGSEIIMRQLQKQPAYKGQTCRTRWITIGTGNL